MKSSKVPLKLNDFDRFAVRKQLQEKVNSLNFFSATFKWKSLKSFSSNPIICLWYQIFRPILNGLGALERRNPVTSHIFTFNEC